MKTYDLSKSNSTFKRFSSRSFLVFATFGLLFGLMASPGQAATDFSDVPNGHTFKTQISWLADSGITTGYPDGTFRPQAPVLREQMAVFLYRLAGEPPVANLPSVSPFRDVATNHSFYKAIVWLSRTGISTGYDEGRGIKSFRPSDPVLREQMAAFLYRYRSMTSTPQAGSGSFTDVPASATFYNQIRWLSATKITTGYPDGSFRPAAPVLREQMAAFLNRYDDNFDQEVVPGPFTAAPTPVVRGQAQVGQQLTATVGVWTPEATNVTYQWLVDGSTIVGANGVSYTPVNSDVGKRLTFRATATRPGSSPSVVNSSPTATVTAMPASSAVDIILADTNAFRAQNGLAPLAIIPQINTIAYNWAKHMGDTCTFNHNPNYSSQYPAGWRRAGENIAGGQQVNAVVQAWIDSPGHRANLLGDYTHIGIGYYTTPNCYGRYYVQNFAKY